MNTSSFFFYTKYFYVVGISTTVASIGYTRDTSDASCP